MPKKFVENEIRAYGFGKVAVQDVFVELTPYQLSKLLLVAAAFTTTHILSNTSSFSLLRSST